MQMVFKYWKENDIFLFNLCLDCGLLMDNEVNILLVIAMFHL